MILDVLSSFDAAYEQVRSSLDFDLDYTICENLIKGKEILNPFLSKATLDCFTKSDSGVYSNMIFNNKEYLNFFKEKHTKKEFIDFIGILNKHIAD